MTEVDSLHMVLLEFGDVGVYEASEDALGETLTLHEVIEREFATVKAPLLEVVTWLVENVGVRPGFAELVERFDRSSISSGFHELIEPILAREGVEVELLANRLDPRPDGWRVSGATRRSCAVCGEPCKRASLGASRSSTSATATPTAAPRSRPSGSSRATGSPSTSTSRASRTSRSRR